MERRAGDDLRVCHGVVREDIAARLGIPVPEPGGEPDAGCELGVASCVAIG